MSTILIDWAEVSNALRSLGALAHGNARAKGFWDNPRPVAEQLCLWHSEISEALEEYRDSHPLTAIRVDGEGKPLGFPVEVADLMIRVLDTCHAYGIDLANAIKMKAEYNATRPVKHGGKLC